MKILKGEFRGRSIRVPPNIRAVSLRVKKALFDILKEEVPQKKVLDLFSGSGSLGIEALSLGAREATFVDIKKGAFKTIGTNLASLRLTSRARVYLKDTIRAIKDFYLKGERFDIIFLDPPYYKGLVRKTLQTLAEYDILTPHGFIVVTCYCKDKTDKDYKGFSNIFSKNYGQTLLVLYKKIDESSDIPRDI
jgi:16S rRNA (guanine(966)-N(2))-methyltransferase RsmD